MHTLFVVQTSDWFILSLRIAIQLLNFHELAQKNSNTETMSADSELSSILNRRQQINDALENGEEVKHTFRPGNIYTEFHEFSRKEIKDYQSTFSK